MMIKPVIILLLLIAMNFHHVESQTNLSESVANQSWFTNLNNLIEGSDKIYRMSQKLMKIPQEIMNVTSNMYMTILKWITHDSAKIDKIEAQLTNISLKLNWIMTRLDAIQNAITQIPLQIEIDSIQRDLNHAFNKINHFYNLALMYSMDLPHHNRVELENAAIMFTGWHTGDLRDSLLNLYHYIVPTSQLNTKDSFLDILKEQMKAKGNTLCGKQSSNLYLYNLYKAVVTMEMMGQVGETFGYYLQHSLHNVSVEFELKRALLDRKERLKNYFRQFKNSIDKTSLSSRPCDPVDLIRGDTFIEMEKLYKAIAVRDMNLNYPDSCWGTCNEIYSYNYTESYSASSSPYMCRRLFDCYKLYIREVCVSPEGDSRVLDWLRNFGGYTYGGHYSDKCRGTSFYLPKNSWRPFSVCETCLCTCEGVDFEAANEGVQAFSLRMSRSNTDENKVVTGLRFSRNHTIICIQIKQAILLPGGEIDKDSEEWMKCDISYSTYQAARNQTSRRYKELEDYVVIGRFIDSIDLGDIVGGNDRLVTGVKFDLTDKCDDRVCYNCRHITLKVEYMKFNFTSGQLLSNNNSETIGSSSCNEHKINMYEADSPLKKQGVHNILGEAVNHYVTFGRSNLNQDAGQTTLPLLDAQAVAPSAPLTGVGLFYKSPPEAGGFLAFRIYTIDYGKFMKEMKGIDNISVEYPDGNVSYKAVN